VPIIQVIKALTTEFDIKDLGKLLLLNLISKI
jgi:hypothetical protein